MADEDSDRVRARFDRPFPDYQRNATPNDQQRMVAATEYAAHHLGRISKALERLADALAKR